MLATSRYAVTVPGAPGGHAPPEVIIVHLTTESGPLGEPVYADAAGRYRFSITGQTARMLPCMVEKRACHRCLQALPLP